MTFTKQQLSSKCDLLKEQLHGYTKLDLADNTSVCVAYASLHYYQAYLYKLQSKDNTKKITHQLNIALYALSLINGVGNNCFQIFSIMPKFELLNETISRINHNLRAENLKHLQKEIDLYKSLIKSNSTVRYYETQHFTPANTLKIVGSMINYENHLNLKLA